MICFNCDYNEGCHPSILKLMEESNMEQYIGYGDDPHTQKAYELIKKECQNEDVLIRLIFGGTQANMLSITAALRPHQGVITSKFGHIQRHETGAIEARGHRVIPFETPDGKITAEAIAEFCDAHYHDESQIFLVQPGMVYISLPTEMGSVYTKSEILEIKKVCEQYNMYLYVDGARLGYGMAAEGCDVDLPFLAHNTDMFYIGGTKQGALCGEAVVIVNPELKKDFDYIQKQAGCLAAKGRLLGIQFEALFTDGLYYKLSEHAVEQAMRIKKACLETGHPSYIDSPSNQQFPIFLDSDIEKLRPDFAFDYEARVDETHSAIRFCPSWATKAEDVDTLIAAIKAL